MTALHEDLGIQQDKARSEQTLADVQTDQLRVLEEMTAAITAPGVDTRALEANADFGLAAVYPNTDPRSMVNRIFGEGRETLEMMIIEVSDDVCRRTHACGPRRSLGHHSGAASSRP